ncbi:P-loop containing nucleoside triphosphate hydrolase protein [Suillus occidentalis]|nr:P-loop containing nucleoside triphosphate hydrolase protein [Suillus occidentalis]
MGISFQVYDQRHRLSPNINLILVSADKAKFKTWRQYLAQLNEILPVGRIVFDEAHLPLLSEEFRESMRDVHELRQFSMQVILLSATLPQSSIAALKAAFGLLSTAAEIRETSNRPELVYIMRPPAESNALETKAVRIVEHERAGWRTDDRALVFVAYMEDGESLSTRTGWPFYNGSKEMSDASRVQCYQDWRSGKSPVMICTSAFSTGNDYPHVRLVVHLKTPIEMSELVQAQGRGGRDGLPARCYVLPSSSPHKISVSRSAIDHKGLWYAHDHFYAHGLKRCLRYGSTLYVDGRGIECREDEKNQPCCVCNKDSDQRAVSTAASSPHQRTAAIVEASASSSGRARTDATKKRPFSEISEAADPFAEATANSKKLRTGRQEERMKRVDRMRTALNKLKDKGCTLCYASGYSQREVHKLGRCPSWEDIGCTLGKYFDWKKDIRYSDHKGICWKCHVPTCGDELHAPLVKEKGDDRCDWPDIVVPLALAIFLHTDLKEAAEKYFGVEWATMGEFTRWLVKPPGPGCHSKGMDLLLWYVEVHGRCA